MEENIIEENSSNNYHCNDCNTSFYHDTLSEKVCIFCNSNNINELQETNENNSYFIVPFVKSIDDAIKCYKKKVLWNPFIPFSLRKKKNYQKIKKVYIPCYLLDAHVDGNVSYQAIDKYGSSEEKYNVLLKTSFDYNQLLLNKCSVFSNSLFEAIGNIDSNNIVDYDSSFLQDVYLVKDNLNFTDISDKLKNQIIDKCLNISGDGVLHNKKSVKDNGLEVSFQNMKEVLIPVYYLMIKHKEKKNYYLMNGENGKYNYKIINSKLAIALFSVILFLILLLISYFVFFVL